MIRLSNVNKYFFKGKQNEIHVINDISLELPQKGMVAFFGPSGCGKTTLLNTIGGLDDIKSGSIEVDGKDIRKNTDDLRNRYIGYIFQNYNLNLKVSNYENVAESLRLCGMEDEETISERVYAALANVGMEKFAHRMPDTLSGGQKQRIAIARAIVKNPAIILADEPTGNLDEANTIVIMDLLKSISKEHLVLLVTHETELVDYYCDQVIGLKDGRVTEIRENEDANGYVGRDKNVVYLGDYEKKETTLGHVRLSCYGDDLPEEVSVRIVNRDGTILLMCDSPKVKLVDANSEITFREGSFEEEQERRHKEQVVHMETLPPFEGKRFGRLFHWKNALHESAQQIAGPKTKGDKMLKRVMGFFAVIIVLFFAMAGKDIKTYLDAKASFNHNIFEVIAPLDSLAPVMEAMATKKAGIDSIMQTGAVDFDVTVDLFNTFRYKEHSPLGMVTPITTNGVMLPMDLAEGKKVVVGRGIDELKPGEVLITSFMADKMVESSKMGFIKGRSDLIGLTLNRYRIAGIVAADEPAVYISMNDLYLGRKDHYSEELDAARFMKDDFEITDRNRYQVVEVQVHSTDTKATKAFLSENVNGDRVQIRTPDDLLDDIAGEELKAVMKKMVTVLIFVLMLSFCMLMIMRSSVMSRVREIGVYRCIGVTRKNMYFRFMVEGLVTASMYILPTYLLIVGIIHWITHWSGIQMEIFLPWWICVPVLIFLYLLAVICALLPIYRLLKKTPAQIMAKYDI